MIDTQLQSFFQISNIESNKQFQRLSEKTQVLVPQHGQVEVVKNRLTHSYEVANSTLLLAANIAKLHKVLLTDIDYKSSFFATALLHDIGHPSFGHDGANFLDEYFKNIGVPEGFSDNNNNLVVIEKNNIVISNYVTVSVIKYPDKLYDFQKEKYSQILKKAINDDKIHYKSLLDVDLENQKTTIGCQIMDEADRNSYACSDLSDFLCLGNTIKISDLHKMAKKENVYYRYSELTTLTHIILTGSKGSIKAYFNNLKNRFNMNYNLTKNGITVIDSELENYRDFLCSLCFEFFIAPIRKDSFHKNNMKLFKKYVNDVVNGEHSPSEYYTKKINSSISDIEKHRYMRDMIAEVSDWYIIQYK